RRKPSLARCFSSATNVVRAPHSVNLSPEKMRTLIAMYHQAETFVTKENLDEKINDAFIRKHYAVSNERTSLSLSDFEGVLRARRDAPGVAEWNAAATTSFNPVATFDAPVAGATSWSGSELGVRDLKVIEALYGVETLGGKSLPGWDILNDNGDAIRESEKEDQDKYED
ncbi:hypothetical protein C8R47DRAFT_937022, partial [Mycena vitilis]